MGDVTLTRAQRQALRLLLEHGEFYTSGGAEAISRDDPMFVDRRTISALERKANRDGVGMLFQEEQPLHEATVVYFMRSQGEQWAIKVLEDNDG